MGGGVSIERVVLPLCRYRVRSTTRLMDEGTATEAMEGEAEAAGVVEVVVVGIEALIELVNMDAPKCNDK